MRILQIVKTSCGARWAYEQAKWLHEHGITVHTVLPDIGEGMALLYKESGMPVLEGNFEIPLHSPWKFGHQKRELLRLLAEVDPDLIHMHFVTNVMFARIVLRRSTIPRLFQVPGPLHMEHALFRKAETRLATMADFWAAGCSRTHELYLNEGIPSDRVFLDYYGGYGGQTCEAYSDDTGILRQELGLSDDAHLVGMVSYFYRPKWYLMQRRGLKGHEDFIDAIAYVREKRPNVVGLVVGGAWKGADSYVDRVKRYAGKRCPGGIVFTGFRKDLKQTYRELEIAVHPSHSENLGGAAESLAAAIPTVSTDVGGFPDIVHDGATGRTVPSAQPLQLAEAIMDLLDNPARAQEMALEGQRLVRDLLDIEKTGRDVLFTYRKLMASRDD